MSGLFIHQEPEYAYRMFAPCAPAATATFDVGDPVQLATNQLSDCADDQIELALANIIGFACEPAEGTTAGSRGGAAADGFGVVENRMTAYWPFDAPGLLLRTRHFWLAGDVVTPVAKEGTEIGDLVNMKGETGTNRWGLEEEAPTAGTDAEFQIVAILDDNMNPIDADATVALGTAPATGDTNGWIVFRPVRGLLSQLTEGGA
jgi:hypothetical protein